MKVRIIVEVLSLFYFSYYQHLPWVTDTEILLYDPETKKIIINPSLLNCMAAYNTQNIISLVTQPEFTDFFYSSFIKDNLEKVKGFHTTETEFYWVNTFKQLNNFSVILSFDFEKISISINEKREDKDYLILDMEYDVKSLPVFTWYDEFEKTPDLTVDMFSVKSYIVWDLMMSTFEYLLRLIPIKENKALLSQIKTNTYKFLDSRVIAFSDKA